MEKRFWWPNYNFVIDFFRVEQQQKWIQYRHGADTPTSVTGRATLTKGKRLLHVGVRSSFT